MCILIMHEVAGLVLRGHRTKVNLGLININSEAINSRCLGK